MRLLLIALALACASAAAADTPNARSAYVERRGILELDARCRFFALNVRAALTATSQQARHALLRDGWTNAQVNDLEQTVVAAAQARSCRDPRTTSAVADARRASAVWLNANAMPFPGWSRTWFARRVAGSDGWRLSQIIDSASGTRFGVRIVSGREQLVLTLPIVAGQTATSTTSLVMRDPARTDAVEISLPQRMSFGLSAGAPSPAGSVTFQSIALPRQNGGAEAIYAFPDLAFRDLIALDPREAVEVHIDGAASQVFLVEVGDVAVARAFLAIH